MNKLQLEAKRRKLKRAKMIRERRVRAIKKLTVLAISTVAIVGVINHVIEFNQWKKANKEAYDFLWASRVEFITKSDREYAERVIEERRQDERKYREFKDNKNKLVNTKSEN